MNAIIIEDEPRSKRLLQNFIRNYCEGVTILEAVETVEEAIIVIKKTKPDLIFLDIELRDGNGFEVLNHFPDPQFITIFVTGYDHYALQAIKKSALDYILKPIVVKELVAAVKKAKKKIKELQFLKDVNSVVDIKKVNDHKLIIVDHNREHTVVTFKDVLYLQASNQYTRWYLNKASNLLVRKSLSEYENILPDCFFRVHRSFIVNLNFVSTWEEGRGGSIFLSNNTKLPISYRKKTAFAIKLQKIIR